MKEETFFFLKVIKYKYINENSFKLRIYLYPQQIRDKKIVEMILKRVFHFSNFIIFIRGNHYFSIEKRMTELFWIPDTL